VLIRSATPDDYDVIFEIFSEILDLHFRAHPEAFKPPLKDEHFKTFFDGVLRSSNRHLVLGLQDDQPVGYLLFAVGGRKESVYQFEDRFVWIDHIVVKEEHRGKGYGKAFLDYVKGFARHLHIREVGLDVWSFNESARACFLSQGFKVVHETMWLDWGEDLQDES
jgi:GNAT superfamily N-acetyltransferase